MPNLPSFFHRASADHVMAASSQPSHNKSTSVRRFLFKGDEATSFSGNSEEVIPHQPQGSDASRATGSGAAYLFEKAMSRRRSSTEGRLNKSALSNSDSMKTVDERETLLSHLKMQVKQVMEEAVTRKFIHEENCSVTSLCAAIEACLLCGLRRQVGSFFRGPSSWDLLCKVASSGQCPAAQQVHLRVIQEQQQHSGLNQNTSNNNGNINGRPSAGSDSSSNSPSTVPLSAGGGFFTSSGGVSLQKFFRDSTSFTNDDHLPENSKATYSATRNRYLWLRIALCEKYLADIVDYLVKNTSKYYAPESVLGDPCHGELFLHLLAGPCTLDYTKLKTCDHLWTDPPADELVQRHNLQHGGLYSKENCICARPFSLIQNDTDHLTECSHPTSADASTSLSKFSGNEETNSLVSPHPRSSIINIAAVSHPFVSPSRVLHSKPSLVIRSPNGNGSSEERRNSNSGPPSAKDYVEALHQNSKTVNIYGKNNVMVQPRENVDCMPGYLGLHSSARGLFVQWIPNQLMSTYSASNPHNTSNGHSPNNGNSISSSSPITSTSPLDTRHWQTYSTRTFFVPQCPRVFWDYALTINLDEIAYIHCHQRAGTGGSLVFVDVDGIQRPPLHFPQSASHMLSFLSHLEGALAPKGRLDPPLWTQRGKGKVFPNLKRRSTFRKSPRYGHPKDIFEKRTLSCEQMIKHEGHLFDCMPPETSDSPEIIEEIVQDNDGSSSRRASTQGPHADGQTSENVIEHKLADESDEVDDEQEHPLDFVFRIVSPHQYNHKGVCDEPWMDIIIPGEKEQLESPQSNKFSDPGNNQNVSNQSGRVAHSLLNEPPPNVMVRRRSSSHRHQQLHNRNGNRASIVQLCTTMRKQILARAFYGWLTYSQRMHKIRDTLSDLVFHNIVLDYPNVDNGMGLGPLTNKIWKNSMDEEGRIVKREQIERQIYLEGCTPQVRKEVWPFLLGVYEWTDTKAIREKKFIEIQRYYEESLGEWLIVEAIVRQREPEEQMQYLEMESGSTSSKVSALENSAVPKTEDSDSRLVSGTSTNKNSQVTLTLKDHTRLSLPEALVSTLSSACVSLSNSKESLMSPAASPASNGGLYSADIQKNVSENMHRIDKDVSRCDRTYEYFHKANRQIGVHLSAIASSIGSGTGNPNLDKLRNIMCTYVWQHLQDGYVQGMCDLLAPILVVVDDEPLAHACFERLMMKMRHNFPADGENPGSTVMDQYFFKLKSLVQILDPTLLEHMHQNSDCANFYFSYRWFLLNFKRELKYETVFWVWETIWTAQELTSPHFVIFVALALILNNRDIIIQNEMDSTDIIRFFNERAEKHNAAVVLRDARQIVHQLQTLFMNN